MARIRSDPAYQRYLQLPRDELNLPPFAPESEAYTTVHPGEVYCRAEGCHNDNKFSSTNNLKKHIQSAHQGRYDIRGSGGGRPNHAVEAAALAFFSAVMRRYDQQQQGRFFREESSGEKEEEMEEEEEEEGVSQGRVGGETLSLPKRKAGKGHHISNMMKQVRAMGHEIPCDVCRSAGIRCCQDPDIELVTYCNKTTASRAIQHRAKAVTKAKLGQTSGLRTRGQPYMADIENALRPKVHGESQRLPPKYYYLKYLGAFDRKQTEKLPTVTGRKALAAKPNFY